MANLVPYGPEKPRSGMVKSTGTHQVEIFWDPPKGEFTKYTLLIEKIGDLPQQRPSEMTINILRMSSMTSNPSYSDVAGKDEPIFSLNQSRTFQKSNPFHFSDATFDKSSFRHIESLSYKLTEYTILGLDPGEKYRIELGTKTGLETTRAPIAEVIMTKPMPVKGIMVNDISPTTAVVHWLDVEGHPCLKGFQIIISSGDGKVNYKKT